MKFVIGIIECTDVPCGTCYRSSHHNGRNRTSEKTIKYRKIIELLLVKKILNIIKSK